MTQHSDLSTEGGGGNCQGVNFRMQQLLLDIQLIKVACNADENCPFENLIYKDFVFSFEYHKGITDNFYWINITDDYPENSILTLKSSTGDFETIHHNKRLPLIFNTIAKGLYKEFHIHMVDNAKKARSEMNNPETSNNEMDDMSDDSDDPNHIDYYEHSDDEKDGAPVVINSQLSLDLERLLEFYEKTIFNQWSGINECGISVPVSTEFLDKDLSAAWKLNHQEPVIIRLHLSLSHYLDGQCPTVTVFQQSQKVQSIVVIQLKNILTEFLKDSSNRLTNDVVKEAFKKKSGKKSNLHSSFLAQVQSKKSSVKLHTDQSGLQNGFLVQVIKYAERRLSTLNDYCVICDGRHCEQFSAMLKPTVCSKELCTFSFQTLGVMSNASDEIASQPEVVDLLIAMANAACRSSRQKLIFDPYPTVVDPTKPSELALNPVNKDYNKVMEILDKFPNSEEMFNIDETSLKKVLDAKDLLIYPLLQWIIASNRSHIIKLKKDKQLDFMKTNHQYLLRSSPPAKEALFIDARKKYGSTYAFHGSNIENWHSILRIGLINASGTKYQLHGTAYGNGIYLSPDASTSFGYSDTHSYCAPSKKQSSKVSSSDYLRSTKIICIALCEVITSQDLKRSGSIWVQPNPDYVVTRFFFVYDDGSRAQNINSQNETILKMIRNTHQQ